MKSQTLTQQSAYAQVISKDAMDTRLIHNHLCKLIEDYGTKDGEGYELFVQDLPFHEQKLLLQVIVSTSDFDFYNETAERLVEGIEEEKGYMQQLIDSKVDEVFYEDQYNGGFDE